MRLSAQSLWDALSGRLALTRHQRRDWASLSVCATAEAIPGGHAGTYALAALGTNLVEGINNPIKLIACMAYDYRDDHYFFLKIRAAFPANR